MPKTLIRQHRSRLISFRVTESELQELVSACSASDARSLSDFARQAALQSARLCATPEAPRAGEAALDGTLTRLNSTLTEIMRVLRTGPPEDQVQTRSPLRDYAAPSRLLPR